ncbi:DUF2892 domain-containing protein [Mangrovimonas sp. AS39]|uniref:YgaP family membrane protein n=1 Tax=Mangrovimonas TaxID=1211036 RepID=UPI0014209614|nr:MULTISPECIES: DUF2892 domain-containing protein [Mangrovimonas]MCF1191507.1 DUF2892 domain-containing protein [Mangrovimonas futianensis]MCF1195202.1 DUF2892 domain-containing protein [Mangrovimonas futianensis]MCF1421119.1 DUF2892 domain-containing protein [Mangrovimonas futianensis]NIK92256.1 DUF2892 domain-containing protein [Mangrovimonas sp. CR14]
MKNNMGNPDRTIRLLLAVVFIALGYFNIIEGTIAIILYVLAAVFILTSLVGFCPLYPILGINTCKK